MLVFVVLIHPLTDYLGNLRQEDRSYVSCLATTEVGVMWFVAALLAFTVAVEFELDAIIPDPAGP